MTVWLGILLLSLFCILLVGWAGRRQVSVVRSDPLSFYKAQLADIETDVSAGMLSNTDAETASLEIKRRLLKVGDKNTVSYHETKGGWLFFSLGAVVISVAISLYAFLGKPNIAGHAHETQKVMDQQISPDHPTTFNEAIAGIRLRLQATPNDVKGWEMLGNTLSSLRRYAEAADAFSHAAQLNPENTSLQLSLAEQIMAMHFGQVVPAASNVFQTMLQLNPEHPAAHFYLGLAQKQAGNNDNAQRIWKTLVESAAPDAPWLPAVKAELASLNAPSRQVAGPSQSDVEAVSNMSAEDQAAFINAMLDKLKAKLEDNPDNAQGWIMLARSEKTRGNSAAAIQALEDGLKVVSEEDKPSLQIYLNSLKNADIN